MWPLVFCVAIQHVEFCSWVLLVYLKLKQIGQGLVFKFVGGGCGWYFFLCSRYLVQFSLVPQSCPTLCDPMDCSMPDFPELTPRGWDGLMASPTQWTWVWVNSGSWWWTARPGKMQSVGSQKGRQDWATELNWTELKRLFGKETISESFVLGLKKCPW